MADEPMQEQEQSKTEPPESGAGYDDPDEVRRPLGDADVPGGGATLASSHPTPARRALDDLE